MYLLLSSKDATCRLMILSSPPRCLLRRLTSESFLVFQEVRINSPCLGFDFIFLLPDILCSLLYIIDYDGFGSVFCFLLFVLVPQAMRNKLMKPDRVMWAAGESKAEGFINVCCEPGSSMQVYDCTVITHCMGFFI